MNQWYTYTSRTRCVDIQVQTVFIRIYAILPTAALNASISKVRGVVNLASPTTLLYRSPESQRSNGWLCKWYPLEDIDVFGDIDELIFLESLGGTKEGTLLYSDLRLGSFKAHQQPKEKGHRHRKSLTNHTCSYNTTFVMLQYEAAHTNCTT